MGFIGMGKQNRGLLGGFLGHGARKVLAVCDVDTTRREDAKKRVDEYYAQKGEQGSQCAAYNDFREIIQRKDIDAVCIATPDHWHAIITLAALRAGKDVYCEKPLTHNIHEAVEVIRAVDANQRVLQTGSMQRSSKEFRVACELVQNGAIGKVERVECSFGDPGVPCDLPEEPMEPGLDWNLWVGPAPMRPYNSVLSPRGMHKHSRTGVATANSAAAWSPTGAPTIWTSPSGAWAWTTAARWKSCRRKRRAPSAAPSWSMPTA